MERTEASDDSPSRYWPFEPGPYPSTIVNRGALPESWFFWRRWRRPKPAYPPVRGPICSDMPASEARMDHDGCPR